MHHLTLYLIISLFFKLAELISLPTTTKLQIKNAAKGSRSSFKVGHLSGKAANMALKTAVSKAGNIFLGICTPCLRHNASKIKIQTMELDEKLLQFFRKSIVVFAHDPNKICKSGDIVLIQELPEKMSTSITHKVLEVVYPLGDITDPITGKKVAGTKYRDELEEEDLAFGKVQPTFDYKKAPKRGWQEGKKDFTHRENYIKYNEFEEGDENKNQPFSTMYS